MPGTTSTRRAIRRLILDKLPQLGFYGTADSVAVGSITDTYAFQDSALGVNHFRGTYIYRPTTSGDDITKKAGNVTVATGVLAQTGSNYTNTTETLYEILGPLHPDEFNACIQRALRHVYFETQWPASVLTDTALEGSTAGDGDMASSGTTSWTTIGTSTLSKSPNLRDVFSGLRSLRCANSATNSGAESIPIRVQPNDPIFVSAICRSASGTARLRLWDNTNAAEIRSYTSTRDGWTHIWISENAPATTESITVRLLGNESTADVYWDHVIVYRLFDRRLHAPSWLDEPWKMLKLRRAIYSRNLADHVDDANSRYFADYYTPKDFTLDAFHPEAASYAIQMQRSLPVAGLWLEAKRPFFDIEPLTADTDTTTAPLLEIVAYAELELAEILNRRYPTDPQWKALLETVKKDVEAQTMSRPEIPDQPARRNFLGRI